MVDQYLLTAPDLDHSTRHKLMVVGLDRSQVDLLVSKIQLLPHALTFYVFSTTDTDQVWCLNAARQCDSILVDVNPGNHDLLKGYLLAFPNSSALGHNLFARKIYHDPVLWLTDGMLRYQNVIQLPEQA